jgi:hypothetical protein
LTAPSVHGYIFVYWDIDGASQGNGVNPINVTTGASHLATAHYVPRIDGDINGDRTVNILDGVLLGRAYTLIPTSPNWNPDADLNHDGIIDIFDAIILSSNFGKRN